MSLKYEPTSEPLRNPQPSTLNPQPSTLNRNPQTKGPYVLDGTTAGRLVSGLTCPDAAGVRFNIKVWERARAGERERARTSEKGRGGERMRARKTEGESERKRRRERLGVGD